MHKISDTANLQLFADYHKVTCQQAVEMILHRYFSMQYNQREKLEQKIFWQEHRNKGFRSLPQFFVSATGKTTYENKSFTKKAKKCKPKSCDHQNPESTKKVVTQKPKTKKTAVKKVKGEL